MSCIQIWHDLDGERAEHWNALREQCVAPSPYHDPSWIVFLEEQLGMKQHHLVVWGADGLSAVLPCLARRLPWSITPTLSALPLSHNVFPLALTPQAAHMLEEELTVQGASRVWKGIDIHSPMAVPRPYDQMHGTWTLVEDRWISVLDLEHFQQCGARKCVHATAMRNARKAEASGVTIQRRPMLHIVDDLYRLLLETRQRQGVPAYPEVLVAALQKVAHAQAFVALFQGEIQATLVFLTHKGEAVYLYGASTQKACAVRANDLLFLTALQELAAEGYSRCDFGTSPHWHHELVRFKEKWGCATVPWGRTVWRPAGRAIGGDMRNSWAGKLASECITRMPRSLLGFFSDRLFRFLV